jgi:hypothetical protein
MPRRTVRRLKLENVTMRPHINSTDVSLYAAAISVFLLAFWPHRIQAMFFARPGPIIVEKMTIDAQWRHRHHQLRRRSRQQSNDERRSRHGGDPAVTDSTKR